MKKFLLLLNKEIRELLTAQMLVPFIAVIVVFYVIGSFAGKQIKEQTAAKEVIAVYDLDNSALSSASTGLIEQIADVKEISADGQEDFVQQMENDKISAGIIFPSGFEKSIKENGKAEIEDIAIINNFSVTANKKYATLSTAIATINNYVSDNLINSAVGTNPANNLKNPIVSHNFVSSKGKIIEGNAIQVLSYISQQTTFVPIILFIVIIMAAQMIASTVASENENKTLETLLSLPISRTTIATTKMVAAGLVSLLMAAIYMFGFRSFNNGLSSGFQTQGVTGESASQVAHDLGLTFNTFGFVELGGLLFLGILLALAIAMILGAFSEDAKSAQGVVAPLMILVMIPYFIVLFLDVNSLSTVIRYLVYAIPFSHLFLAPSNILLGNNLAILYGTIYLLILFIIFVIIAGKIFGSDLILTMKLNFSKKKN